MSDRDRVVLPLDCETVVRALWAYLDGEVGADEQVGIRRHLEQCAYCRAHADFERELADRLAELRREHSDPDRLRRRVVATLRAAGMGG